MVVHGRFTVTRARRGTGVTVAPILARLETGQPNQSVECHPPNQRRNPTNVVGVVEEEEVSRSVSRTDPIQTEQNQSPTNDGSGLEGWKDG